MEAGVPKNARLNCDRGTDCCNPTPGFMDSLSHLNAADSFSPPLTVMGMCWLAGQWPSWQQINHGLLGLYESALAIRMITCLQQLTSSAIDGVYRSATLWD